MYELNSIESRNKLAHILDVIPGAGGNPVRDQREAQKFEATQRFTSWLPACGEDDCDWDKSQKDAPLNHHRKVRPALG